MSVLGPGGPGAVVSYPRKERGSQTAARSKPSLFNRLANVGLEQLEQGRATGTQIDRHGNPIRPPAKDLTGNVGGDG
jgi:hypothetical protein